jgi:hypothetical protein
MITSLPLRIFCPRTMGSIAISIAMSTQTGPNDCDSDEQLSDIISLGPNPHLPFLPRAQLPSPPSASYDVVRTM